MHICTDIYRKQETVFNLRFEYPPLIIISLLISINIHITELTVLLQYMAYLFFNTFWKIMFNIYSINYMSRPNQYIVVYLYAIIILPSCYIYISMMTALSIHI